MLNNNLDFKYFIVSFSIGMLFVYMYQPKKEIVYKFPNPNNVDKVLYKDNEGVCYKFKYEKKNCEVLTDNEIKEHPIVENFIKITP
jgi:hypothetical protein